MKGTVKFFNHSKGFGFIAGEDGKEYFVHITGLAPGTRISDNDEVTFSVEEGERGPKAVNVTQGGGESAPAEESSDEPEESDDFQEDRE